MARVNQTRTLRFIVSVAALFLGFGSLQVTHAQLNTSRARGALRRMAGFELTNGAVRVRTISEANKTSATVTAELRTVFRFEQDDRGRWRVAEVRVAPDRWEDVAMISSALATQFPEDQCNAPGFQLGKKAPIEPTPKRVRCLLGSLLGVAVPSDAIRIQEIAPSPVPLASQESATVVTWIGVEARAISDAKGWRITDIRTGDREWVNLDQFVAALNQQKQNRARLDMQRIVDALERYRTDKGAYIVSDSHAVLIDHLSPAYIREVIRLDPWRQPYKYVGQRDHFTLVSPGPDGKDGTADDVARSK
ncbi:MAG TPA: type II secretion system protein GspG [Pyrinomonadaceae bacterium]|nr:type II secretion system protein GspG [Pyrinomonadaceae bacterium]